MSIVFSALIFWPIKRTVNIHRKICSVRRRRSPKKTPQKIAMEEDVEKLSQEAFRLFRTAQNLLSIKDPILSETKTGQFIRNAMPDQKSISNGSLQRKLKSRESRNSYQSSSTSDGSINSNSSSSRHGHDDDHRCCNENLTNDNHRRACVGDGKSGFVNREMEALTIGKDQRVKSVASNSADDESGFSSMNSFHHEIPNALLPLPLQPLNSTMISNQFATDASDCGSEDICPMMPEIKPALPIMHKRWDSAPPIPPKKNLATFSSLQNGNGNGTGDDNKPGIHVLWV